MAQRPNEQDSQPSDRARANDSGNNDSPEDSLSPEEAEAELRQIVDKFAALLTNVGQRTTDFLNTLGERERVQLAQIYSRRLPGLANGVYDFLIPEFRAGSSEDQNLAIRYLRATGVETMIDETQEVLGNRALNPISLLGGLPSVLEVIKKIIRYLSDIPFLGRVVGLIDTILKLIDNILEALGANVSDNVARNYAAAFERYSRYTRPRSLGEAPSPSSDPATTTGTA